MATRYTFAPPEGTNHPRSTVPVQPLVYTLEQDFTEEQDASWVDTMKSFCSKNWGVPLLQVTATIERGLAL